MFSEAYYLEALCVYAFETDSAHVTLSKSIKRAFLRFTKGSSIQMAQERAD